MEHFGSTRVAEILRLPIILFALAIASCTHAYDGTSEKTIESSASKESALAKAEATGDRNDKRIAQLQFMSRPNSFFEEKLDQPVIVDGQKLHPKLQYEFEERRAKRAKSGINYNDWLTRTWATPKGRKWLRDEVDLNWTFMAEQNPPLLREEAISIPGADGQLLPVKIYSNAKPSEKPKPVLVYFHGGGFIMASVKAVEPQMRILARSGDITVVSVDYRLAPEAPFPAAFEDGLAAYHWVLDNLDQVAGGDTAVGVAGDSAGGNIAAVISDEAARRGWRRPDAQLLYYPVTDMDFDQFKSYSLFGEGYGLDRDFIRIATQEFVSDPELQKHRWLTLLKNADFGSQPPTIIAVAGFDPIRDHGIEYAKAINAAGGIAELIVASSLNHGFLEASGVIDDAKAVSHETARRIGAMLRNSVASKVKR